MPCTSVCARFTPEESADLDEIHKRRVRCGEQLLRRINRLLRWYRSVSRQADITELTRAQVSPFQFAATGAAPPAEWTAPLEYEAVGPQPAVLTLEQTTQAVRDGLASGNDPDVADLFLLDAERAVHQGRFRETVLFCWSTIDSVFNRRYDALVDAALLGEWGEAQEFFKGLDFKLRNKISAGMSPCRESVPVPGAWRFPERLSASYSKQCNHSSWRECDGGRGHAGRCCRSADCPDHGCGVLAEKPKGTSDPQRLLAGHLPLLRIATLRDVGEVEETEAQGVKARYENPLRLLTCRPGWTSSPFSAMTASRRMPPRNPLHRKPPSPGSVTATSRPSAAWRLRRTRSDDGRSREPRVQQPNAEPCCAPSR